MEHWLPVVGYEGIYQVSDLGRVRRIGAWSDGRKRAIHVCSPKRKRGVKGATTYLSVSLSKHGAQKFFQVHRLVAVAFLGTAPDQLAQVNHKNGNKEDNRPRNLEWVTPSQNQFHAYRVLGAPTRQGSKHHYAKITESSALGIRALRAGGWKLKRIARLYNLSVPTVCWIAKGKAWKHI